MALDTRFAALSGVSRKWLVLEDLESEDSIDERQTRSWSAQSLSAQAGEELDAHDGWAPIRLRRYPLRRVG